MKFFQEQSAVKFASDPDTRRHSEAASVLAHALLPFRGANSKRAEHRPPDMKQLCDYAFSRNDYD